MLAQKCRRKSTNKESSYQAEPEKRFRDDRQDCLSLQVVRRQMYRGRAYNGKSGLRNTRGASVSTAKTRSNDTTRVKRVSGRENPQYITVAMVTAPNEPVRRNMAVTAGGMRKVMTHARPASQEKTCTIGDSIYLAEKDRYGRWHRSLLAILVEQTPRALHLVGRRSACQRLYPATPVYVVHRPPSRTARRYTGLRRPRRLSVPR